MNERLKQLAIESKLIAPEYNGFDHTRLLISQQKFAELIVEECVECAIWVGNVNTNPIEPIHTAMAIKKRINSKFGVKE
jgi:hypothetical protein